MTEADRDSRFRRAITQASGGGRTALVGLIALGILVALSLVFGF